MWSLHVPPFPCVVLLATWPAVTPTDPMAPRRREQTGIHFIADVPIRQPLWGPKERHRPCCLLVDVDSMAEHFLQPEESMSESRR